MINYQDIISNIPLSGSTQLLAQIFGGEVYHIFGGGNGFHGPQETMITLFGALLKPAAFWLFIIFASYFLIAGLINQAQDGSFMDRSWNKFWPWVRMAFGTTAVVPSGLMKNLALVQMLVIVVALISSSIADLTWRETLKYAVQDGASTHPILTPSIDSSKTDAYLKQAFNYSACVANQLKYNNTDTSVTIDQFNPIDPGSPQAMSIAESCSGEKFLDFLAYARQEKIPVKPNITPTAGSDLITDDMLSQYHQYQRQQFRYLEDKTILDFIQNHIWPFYVDHMDAINQSEISSGLTNQWQDIIDNFHQTLKDKTISALNSDQDDAVQLFAQQVSKYGWISAANYYRQLAQQQQIINSQITSGLEHSPHYVDMDQQIDLTSADNLTQFHIQRARNWVTRAEDAITSGTKKYIVDPLGIDFLKMGSDTDPILAMTNFGQKLEGIAEVLVMGRQVPKLFSWIPVVGDKISHVLSSGIMNFLVLFLILSGLVLGIILPNLPWIVFLFAIISWLIYVIEMFIAAPFWVVANALPEGGTILSSVAKKGLNNILFIFLFPTLAIGGLVASLGVSWVGISLLNHFVYIAFKGLEGWITLPFDIVGIVLIYVVLAWLIMVHSLSLIQALPRTILNWLSISQPGMNQFEEAHHGARGAIMAVASVGGSAQAGVRNLADWEKSRALANSEQVRERALRKSAEADDLTR